MPPQTSAAALAEVWLFPGIIASMVLGNQPFPIAAAISVPLNWVNLAAGFVVLLSAVRAPVPIAALMGTVVVSKVLRSSSMAVTADAIYIGSTGILFCLAGAVVAFRRPVMLYRQVMWICLANMVFMILQTAGAGAWTQLLTTHGEGNLTPSVPTLFVHADDLEYRLVQGRPAGLSYSNIVLTLIIVFALVLHLTRRRKKVRWGTSVLSVMIAFSMSKFVLSVSPLIALWLMVTGNRGRRRAAARALGGMAMALAAYCVVFPGLAATNLDVTTVATSFYLRLNDLAGALDPNGALKAQSDALLEGTPRASWIEEGEYVSGYAQIVAKAPSLIPAALVGGVVYLLALRSLRRRSRDMAAAAFLVVCIVATYPFTFPPWGLQMYWFMAGLGLLPLLNILQPQFLQRDADRSRRPRDTTVSRDDIWIQGAVR